MYHSITIGDKNTWNDWHLISKVRPFFVPPTQKTKYVEIPGSSGSLDLSESLTGYPVFNNREGSFEFTILQPDDVLPNNPDYPEDKFKSWAVTYSDILNCLNGKRTTAFLEDEPEYYYEGRFNVTGYKPGDSANNTRGTITIGYNVDPYKWSKKNVTDPWEWDIFNFENGVIYPDIFTNITVPYGTTKHLEFSTIEMGNAAVTPIISSQYIGTNTNSGNVILTPSGSSYFKNPTIRFRNSIVGIDKTISLPTTKQNLKFHDFVLYGDIVQFDINYPSVAILDVELRGTSLVISIDFHIGRL